jgi:hypothetical protein
MRAWSGSCPAEVEEELRDPSALSVRFFNFTNPSPNRTRDVCKKLWHDSAIGTKSYKGANFVHETTHPGRIGQNLDEIDASILHFLELHGRATNYEVGEAAGLSPSAASRRIQALESTGAIRGTGRWSTTGCWASA